MKRSILQKVVLALFGFLLTGALAACGGASTGAGANQNAAGTTGEQSSVSTQSANKPNETVHLAVSSWVGLAPLFVAKEKGFFKEEGVDATLTQIEAVGDRRSALAAGQIDGFGTTVDTQVMTAAAGVPVVQVLALDDSYGGDGIVAKKEIATLQDLKGKRVAVETDGGASYFWLLYILKQNNIDPKELQFQSMSAGDAGAAFVAGKVDAAVTWEPWLTNARKTSFGHVLLSSDQTPGVIADTLGFRKDFVEQHPAAVQGVVNAWFKALAYIQSNQSDAYTIMAKAMGQTTDEFTASAKGVRWYDLAKNRDYFGSDPTTGPLYQLTKEANGFWLENGIIKAPVDVNALINAQFIQNATGPS